MQHKICTYPNQKFYEICSLRRHQTVTTCHFSGVCLWKVFWATWYVFVYNNVIAEYTKTILMDFGIYFLSIGKFIIFMFSSVKVVHRGYLVMIFLNSFHCLIKIIFNVPRQFFCSINFSYSVQFSCDYNLI